LNTAVIAGVWNHFQQDWDRGIFSMDEFIAQLNRIISQTFRANQNTTLSVAYACDDKLVLASCGAPTWIKIKPGVEASSVRSAPYDPVGLQLPDVRIRTVELSAEIGEVFVAHTDGVMEGSKVRKGFLKSMTTVDGQLPTGQLFDQIEIIARDLGKDEVLPDDFTMVMIRRTTSETASKVESDTKAA
jgi:hypothetical protein